MAIIGLIAVTIAFAIARVFLPSRSAIVMALSFVLGAATGSLLAAVISSLLFQQVMLSTSLQVWFYFAQLAAAAILMGFLFAKVAFVKLAKMQTNKSPAQK